MMANSMIAGANAGVMQSVEDNQGLMFIEDGLEGLAGKFKTKTNTELDPAAKDLDKPSQPQQQQ